METKQEEIQTDLNNDIIREHSHEIDDGIMDTWIADNREDLIADFLNNYKDEWDDFCRDTWNEHNE